MSVSVEVPSLGESVTEAIIASWSKQPGDFIEADEILVELETDKVSVELPSPISGVITELKANIDDTVNVGDVIAVIEPAEKSAAASSEPPAQAQAPAATPAPVASSDDTVLSPAVQRLVEENSLDATKIVGTGPGGRILKGDVLDYLDAQKKPAAPAKAQAPAPAPVATAQVGQEERVRMSSLRRTIARRLVEAQQTTAMLTTFNEVDMTNVMAIRKRYQDRFVKRYDTKLGFMSFFIKAIIEGLKEYPAVNAEIDGNHMVYKNFYHIGIAVGGGKGLVVPVIRNADQMSFAEIELEIKRLGKLARDNKLSLEDLQGGTFTVSNGGVYGSMLSTPILNTPQSGILGMHNIVERPVAINGKVEIRPIMYLALSYDHRIIDGREAVSFLVRIKECIENPERILFEV